MTEAEGFLYLLDTYWNAKVSSVALKTRDAQKYDKKELLPLTSDLKKFTETMRERLVTTTERGIHNQDDYMDISRSVLARLLVFNKRRPKELGQVLLSSWKNRPTNWKLWKR